MQRWDRLQESYLAEFRARGRSEATNAQVRRQLGDWGAWLKRRRPRVVLEQIDPQILVDYVSTRSTFKAKSTVYGVLSKMRGFGDFLVHENVWASNPLRWMQGPKVTPYGRMQRRLDRGHLDALWGRPRRACKASTHDTCGSRFSACCMAQGCGAMSSRG